MRDTVSWIIRCTHEILWLQGSGEGKCSRILAKPRFYKEVSRQPCWEWLRGLSKEEVSSMSPAGAGTHC